jgi:hypothetical protein
MRGLHFAMVGVLGRQARTRLAAHPRNAAGLRESNSHLNLGKVSYQLQKRRKWRPFQPFFEVPQMEMDGKWKMENAHRLGHRRVYP